MIEVSPTVQLDESKLRFQFVRSAGPGGQNVNKLATAAELYVALDDLPLSAPALQRLRVLAGRRISSNDELQIVAQRHRTQERNKADAIARLVTLLQRALVKPKPRVKTKPSLGAKRRRRDSKRQRGKTKRLRGGVSGED